MRGFRWFSSRSYVGAAAWWNSSTTTTSNASGRISSRSNLGQRLDGREYVPAFARAVDRPRTARRTRRPEAQLGRRRGSATESRDDGRQTAGWDCQLLSKPPIVECGHEGLAGTGRRNDEVAVAMMAFPLGFQALEHLALEGPRLEVEVEDLESAPVTVVARTARSKRSASRAGIVRLVVRIGPVALEGGLGTFRSGLALTPAPGARSTRRRRAWRCASGSTSR